MSYPESITHINQRIAKLQERAALLRKELARDLAENRAVMARLKKLT